MTKLNQPNSQPYGTGGDAANAPIIATGEMWGSHCEYIYTNRRYGNGGATAVFFRAFMQSSPYFNTVDLNSYLNAIEHFDPNDVDDVHRWIPQGLPYDLSDARNDNNLPITDEVNNITTSQSFNALQTDVRSIQSFKTRLLQQVGNSQLTEINNLFQEYGY